MNLQALLGFFPAIYGDDPVTTSHIFARWLGVYLVIMCIYALYRGRGIEVVKEEVRRSPTFSLLLGSFNVFFGSFFIASHSLFVWSWPLIITIFGYVILIKGILELFFTRQFHQLHDRLGCTWCRVWSIIWLILGLILIWFGYFSKM